MGRRTSTKTDEDTVAEVEVTESEDTPTEVTPSDEQADGATEQAEAPAFDLTAYNEVVTEAVASRDEATGALSDEVIARVNAEYVKLDGAKAKAAARKVISDGMFAAMNDSDLHLAKAYLDLQQGRDASASRPKAERTPADPTGAYVSQVAALNLAYGIVTDEVPEGVDEGWAEKVTEKVGELSEQVAAFQAWLNSDAEDKGDAPEVDPIVKSAFKIASGKGAGRAKSSGGGGSTSSGERHDIGKHIAEYFEDKEPGHFALIAEIRKFKSNEYGDDLPSAGAISARLFPNGDATKCTLAKNGTPVAPTYSPENRKGAVKLSAEELAEYRQSAA